MGFMSEIKADNDRCKHCGRLLHKHYAGKHIRQTLREWDDDIWLATMVDVTCSCGKVTTIHYIADALPQFVEVEETKLFKVAPTLREKDILHLKVFHCISL